MEAPAAPEAPAEPGAPAPEPAATGLAPPSGSATETPPLFLEIEVTQSEPQLENIFLAKGGPMAAAAARGETDFALTGSEYSSFAKLSDEFATVIRMPVPASLVEASADKPQTVEIDNRAKLIVCGSRVGAGINGGLCSTVAGSGSVYLPTLFRPGHSTISLKYSNWEAHTSVVAASAVRLVDEAGRRYSVTFTEAPERNVALKRAEEIVGKWAEGAWQKRTAANGLRYPLSETLTKSVARVTAGINDSGYDLVHDVVEMRVPYSYQTINSLLEQTVLVDLEFVPEEIATFLGETAAPGKKAASWGRTLAASLSMCANLLVSYRADGRTAIGTDGSKSVAAESWLRQAPRTPMEANDCDGSAILAASLARTIAQAPAEVLERYEYINAAKNTLVPHYTVGVSVLGASAAEASGGGGAAVAGHAATIMIDTLGLLKALEKGAVATVGGAPVVETDRRAAVAQARFDACFSPEVVASLPEEERAELASWATASGLDTGLDSYAVEGTTPASPILHATGKKADDAARNAKLDQAALEKAAPNVGRSIKILYVGGRDEEHKHKFYHDFVEFNLGRSHPLWSAPAVRELGCASSQIVLCQEASRVSGAIGAAGATPRDLVVGAYSAVPLVVADGPTAALLDYASEAADLDVLPPRPPGTQLNAFESAQLARSLASLGALDDAMKAKDADGADDAHTVAYTLAYSTLVNNPLGVEHLCERLKAVAANGMVDALGIAGLATDAHGQDAGRLVVVNAQIAV